MRNFFCPADPSSSSSGHWWLLSPIIFISSSNAQVSGFNIIFDIYCTQRKVDSLLAFVIYL